MKVLLILLFLLFAPVAYAQGCVPMARVAPEIMAIWSIPINSHDGEKAREIIRNLAGQNVNVSTTERIFVFQDPNDQEIMIAGFTADGCYIAYLTTSMDKYKAAVEGRRA